MRSTRRLLTRSTGAAGFLAAALALYSGAMVLDSLAAPVGVFDESQQLLDGLLVEQGLVPHRDFWSPYPPLNYHLLAQAYRWLAPSALAGRLVAAALYLGVLLALALHARAFFPGAPARAAALALAGGVILGNAGQNYWWNAYALAVLAIVVAIHAERAPARWLAGATLALAALAKLNFAAYAAAALGLEVGLRSLRDRSWRAGADAVPLLLPAALAAALWLVAQGSHAPEALDQLLRAPGRDVAPHRALALLPGAGRLTASLFLAFPLLWLALRSEARQQSARVATLGAAAAVVLFVAVAGSEPAGAAPAVPAVIATLAWVQLRTRTLPRDELVLVSAQALFCHYFVYRADDVHRAALLAFGALLLPIGAARLRGAARAGCLALVTGLFALSPASAPTPPDGALRHAPAPERVRTALRLLRSGAVHEGDSIHLLRASLPLGDGWEQLYPDADEIRALQWLADRLESGETIYAGLRDHRQVFLGSTRSYWILGRPPGVRRFVLEPGLTTRDDVQQEMIADLGKQPVRFALLWDRPAQEPGRPAAEPAGSPRLDAYLRRHYRPVLRIGSWSVWEREPPRAGSDAPGRRASRMK